MGRKKYDITVKPINSSQYQIRITNESALDKFNEICAYKNYPNNDIKLNKWVLLNKKMFNSIIFGIWTEHYNVSITYISKTHFLYGL